MAQTWYYFILISNEFDVFQLEDDDDCDLPRKSSSSKDAICSKSLVYDTKVLNYPSVSWINDDPEVACPIVSLLIKIPGGSKNLTVEVESASAIRICGEWDSVLTDLGNPSYELSIYDRIQLGKAMMSKRPLLRDVPRFAFILNLGYPIACPQPIAIVTKVMESDIMKIMLQGVISPYSSAGEIIRTTAHVSSSKR